MTDHEFALKDFIEEIDTIRSERKDFLAKKLERRTIGEPEANLARFRLERMAALAKYLRSIEKFQASRQVEEKPAAEPETIPLAPELEEQKPLQVEEAPGIDTPEPEPESAPALDDWE